MEEQAAFVCVVAYTGTAPSRCSLLRPDTSIHHLNKPINYLNNHLNKFWQNLASHSCGI